MKEIKKQDSFLNYVLEDVLGHIPNISAKSMFGGYGIYRDGTIFAIIAYDQLYFKVGGINIDDYKSRGSEPFVYERGNHKKKTMSYWLVPNDILDNRDEIIEWVEKEIKVSKQKNRS